ncbi:hypothetical protein CXF72_16765 [Psychromonas sp. MB-3u-54]|uniref:DUF3466 family protein n=1 Tax=Psychromonas sp. MB-3u-54 TaxID=2058319 RepID=UPI000C3302DB|nr:DUF3466 family protein [Psychromonas sp. MB-3u-54]PKH01501.1 hypothetical protein CXF72_16765 [Psychromonas sp. MB-3u-54]
MRYKLPLTGVALLLSANGWALPAETAFYSVEKIDVYAEGASYGAYPSAISVDGTFIGTYSMKSYLSIDVDLGLPFTFNRDCQYDTGFCEFAFYGSKTAGHLSYYNAAQVWRNAQSDAQDSLYSSYMMANIVVDDSDTGQQLPYDADSTGSTDVKVTDVIIDSNNDQFVVGYSSAPYYYDSDSYERDFVRRAFIKDQNSGAVTSLLPDFDTNGGFSSAYKIKEVTFNNVTKTFVVGASSVSYAQDSPEYFNNCYFSDTSDEISTINELVNCPGFDTQAWAWEVTGLSDTTQDISGFALATQWLDDNADNNSSNVTYSASALDINAAGIAVGVSTFEYASSSATGGRQRAIIMTPSTDNMPSGFGDGSYDAPTELTEAAREIESAGDQGDTLYNTWAIAITDTNTVLGNREYNVPQAVNKATEFFVYDIDQDSISFPLKDKKVLSTEQDGESSAKTGANSRAYDINESGFIVGKADDYDQTHSVNGGSPRSQSAFLYNSNTDKSWFINDLICSEDGDGIVTSPYYKIRSARVINDNGTVLAEGLEYPTDTDYYNETNATEIMLKLTRNSAVSSPDFSPNCWDSALLKGVDSSYERQGAASFWLWIFALPVLLVRRFIK